ncbi:unnamed protein product [Hymenolepis diminuta]|nr:unnamed protein product [Hymenolepis diminuta]
MKTCVKCVMKEDEKIKKLRERKTGDYCVLKMATRMQKIVLLTSVLVAVALARSFPSPVSESNSESGSFSSLGEPQRDPMTNTMKEPTGQPKKPQGLQGGRLGRLSFSLGGLFSNPNTPVSPIAALLRGKMEMCGRYANYGDVNECIGCILEEDKKLKDLKKQKARSFCQSKSYLPL